MSTNGGLTHELLLKEVIEGYVDILHHYPRGARCGRHLGLGLVDEPLGEIPRLACRRWSLDPGSPALALLALTLQAGVCTADPPEKATQASHARRRRRWRADGTTR